jgi:hypothetical protein
MGNTRKIRKGTKKNVKRGKKDRKSKKMRGGVVNKNYIPFKKTAAKAASMEFRKGLLEKWKSPSLPVPRETGGRTLDKMSLKLKSLKEILIKPKYKLVVSPKDTLGHFLQARYKNGKGEYVKRLFDRDGESVNLLDDSHGELYEIPDQKRFEYYLGNGEDEDAADAHAIPSNAEAGANTEYMDDAWEDNGRIMESIHD